MVDLLNFISILVRVRHHRYAAEAKTLNIRAEERADWTELQRHEQFNGIELDHFLQWVRILQQLAILL